MVGGHFSGVVFAAMGIPIRPALLVSFLVHPAAAQQPIQIPSHADAKKAYYDCLFGYVYDKTDWDVTAKELLDIAVTRCENESTIVLLSMLKEPEIEAMGEGRVKFAKDMRDAFL